ncbi:MAG: 4'-phosphopantetheinyl transferase superfamily protein [Lachnospiraceae bacterium]|jgi:4'-phosphopantetheinyl transferase|nr:4'-phosphopantetheinyl transferase superfamily protein [Lachnospiraceae bacterium]MCI1657689.1 4'-phosphopantetheinyl transferase superfamily protein [Lachnospiraceae bacterium]MCI2196105.1 4'-phosphopantetheinyl transferase superfamily protein [Lachnospiraceae bacterium]
MMLTRIYYTRWDGRHGSHKLLKQAVTEEYKNRGMSCPGFLDASGQDRDGRETKSDPPQKESWIHTGPEGKPWIPDAPEIRFSISHSGCWWACAISDREVGLDIQEERSVHAERLAERFFHPAEAAWLRRHGMDQFCRMWAYKESYLKYTGKGLSSGMDGFCVVGQTETSLEPEPEQHRIAGCPQAVQQEIACGDMGSMVLTAGEHSEIRLIALEHGDWRQ